MFTDHHHFGLFFGEHGTFYEYLTMRYLQQTPGSLQKIPQKTTPGLHWPFTLLRTVRKWTTRLALRDLWVGH
jgi:hypothetical protein